MSEANSPFQDFCSNAWFLILLRGIGLVILGGLFLFKPGIAGIVLVQFLGAYFLVDGLFSTAKSILGRKYMPGWGCGLIMGLLEIVTGAFVFAHPLAGAVITVKVLAYVVAFMAFSFGSIRHLYRSSSSQGIDWRVGNDRRRNFGGNRRPNSNHGSTGNRQSVSNGSWRFIFIGRDHSSSRRLSNSQDRPSRA